MTIDFVSAFLVGLLGAGHCIGMCGGITSMLTTAIDSRSGSTNKLQKSLYVISYNIGRIASYSFIGAIAGYSGSLAIKSIGLPVALLQLTAGIFLIFLGLYIGQWLMVLSKVESLGKKLWQYISPLSKKVIPVDSATKALGLGLIWGWLPCGLVYSTLTWSIASGSALNGAQIMLGFGLGTFPALLTVSAGFSSINSLFKQTIFRKTMALLLICYGFYTVFVAYQLMF